MSTNPDQTVSLTKKGQGRPPETMSAEAPPVHVEDAILPHFCPHCGRGQTPLIVRKEPNGDRHVSCKLCGKGYVYRPAMTRIKG